MGKSFKQEYIKLEDWKPGAYIDKYEYDNITYQLFNLDELCKKVENELDEYGLGVSFSSKKADIDICRDQREAILDYIKYLPEDIYEYIDSPLRKGYNKASDEIATIDMSKINTDNTLEMKGRKFISGAGVLTSEIELKNLTLEDFIGSRKNEIGKIEDASTVFTQAVEELALLFSMEYKALDEKDFKGGKPTTLEEYLDSLILKEFTHAKDSSFTLEVLQQLSSLTIVIPVIEILMKKTLITQDNITDLEANLAGVGAAVNLITLGYGACVADDIIKLFCAELLTEIAVDTIVVGTQKAGFPPQITVIMALIAGVAAGKLLDDVLLSQSGKLDDLIGGGIKSNPLDDPKIAKDVVADPDAVYGYKPKPDSSLDQFDIDWSNPDEVAKARAARLEYLEKMEIKKSKLNGEVKKYLNDGKTMKEIAEIKVEQRNLDRINSYIEKGDYDNLAKLYKRNLKEYGRKEGPTVEQLYKKYGSYEDIVYSSVKVNSGMNVILGIDN